MNLDCSGGLGRRPVAITEGVIYFDNAATSFPKPAATLAAMRHFMEETGGSPGRSGHRLAIAAGRAILGAREALAALFGITDPLRVVLTKNATEALNIVLMGLLRPGDHVVTSAMEHNAVMRPLCFLASQGITLTVVPCSPQGELDPADVAAALTARTRLIVLVHASNVTGTIMPVSEVGRIARERGIIFCVDAAQTAGSLPIDVTALHVDLLAFPGHKSLFGPQGTGGLYVRDGLERQILPLMRGGTGSRSESEEQPEFMPDRFEAGTLNGVGFAGLAAGVQYIANVGMDTIRAGEGRLTSLFLTGLEEIGGLEIFGPRDARRQMPIVSFRIPGVDPAATALACEERFGILCRAGLHCAPAAHATVGSGLLGTVRFSFGHFNTEEQVRAALAAVRTLRQEG